MIHKYSLEAYLNIKIKTTKSYTYMVMREKLPELDFRII